MSVKSRNGSGNSSRLANSMIYRILLGFGSKDSKWRETQGRASVKIRNGSDGLISTDHFTFYVHLYFRALGDLMISVGVAFEMACTGAVMDNV